MNTKSSNDCLGEKECDKGSGDMGGDDCWWVVDSGEFCCDIFGDRRGVWIGDGRRDVAVELDNDDDEGDGCGCFFVLIINTLPNCWNAHIVEW